jgi:phage N-6-adenine-methyltransferase
MVPKVVHSSSKTGGRDDWETPGDLFVALDSEFAFIVDGAADESNHLCRHWYGPDSPLGEDALALPDWRATTEFPNRIFLNPPYSRNADFVRKARAEADAGNALVVLLLPARTDTQWFHELIWDRFANRPHPRTEVRFLKGRLKFSGSADSAPFPSMVVVFHPSVPFEYASEETEAAIDEICPECAMPCGEFYSSREGETPLCLYCHQERER